MIIASYNARRTIAPCLASLRNQTAQEPFEVILADSSSDGTADLVAAEFPEVRLLRFASRRFPGAARNAAIRVAAGRIVAFLDADCTAEPDWADGILRAHQAGYPAVGGAIANAAPAPLIAWASYFCEFSAWMPGRGGRWMNDIAAAGMSYRKDLFAEHGDFLEGTYCSDSEFHWRLAQAGIRLRWEPAILVKHHSIADVRVFLKHEFQHGRFFARVRVRSRYISRPVALLRVCAGPLTAAKLFAAILRRNLRNPVYLGQFVVASPWTALGVAAWTAGECAGYLRPECRKSPEPPPISAAPPRSPLSPPG